MASLRDHALPERRTPIAVDQSEDRLLHSERSCAATATNNFGTDITGGGDAWRAVMSGNPVLAPDARNVNQWFNTSVFSPPALAQQVTNLAGVLQVLARGNTPLTFARGPGINNTDLALFKNFKIRERLKKQLRFEAYTC